VAALEHRRIVVTGGARGIGASTVRALVREGAAVAVLDVLVEAGEELVATVEGPGRAFFLRCDVGRRADVEQAFRTAVDDLGGLDGLVHVAGVETRAPAEDLTDDDWDRVLDVSLRGAFLTNQAAFPHLVEAGGGRVLNFASGAGMDPFPGAAHYSAAKAGVVAWTRTVAHEWGRHGITCNSVVPAMWTPMYDATRAHLDAGQLAAHDAFMAARIPLGGRLGSADDDLAPVLVFLLSEASHFMTGQVVCVDGGLSSVR
jgi:NAD(P)-dependent dehydrogenase (short-subunit alcohol dehydrogenase family)